MSGLGKSPIELVSVAQTAEEQLSLSVETIPPDSTPIQPPGIELSTCWKLALFFTAAVFAGLALPLYIFGTQGQSPWRQENTISSIFITNLYTCYRSLAYFKQHPITWRVAILIAFASIACLVWGGATFAFASGNIALRLAMAACDFIGNMPLYAYSALLLAEDFGSLGNLLNDWRQKLTPSNILRTLLATTAGATLICAIMGYLCSTVKTLTNGAHGNDGIGMDNNPGTWILANILLALIYSLAFKAGWKLVTKIYDFVAESMINHRFILPTLLTLYGVVPGALLEISLLIVTYFTSSQSGAVSQNAMDQYCSDETFPKAFWSPYIFISTSIFNCLWVLESFNAFFSASLIVQSLTDLLQRCGFRKQHQVLRDEENKAPVLNETNSPTSPASQLTASASQGLHRNSFLCCLKSNNTNEALLNVPQPSANDAVAIAPPAIAQR